MIVPMVVLGHGHSTDITGSSRIGLALRAASLKGDGAGDLEGHLSFESTSWVSMPSVEARP